MTPNQIIGQMRRITKVDTSQYTDTEALIDLNTLKSEFHSELMSQVGEDYDYDIWKRNSEVDKSEYSIPEVAYNQAGAKLLNGISVCYNGETYSNSGELIYVKARPITPNTLPMDWTYYVENQSSDDPIYFTADKSLFIAPAPRTLVTNGMKLTGIRKIADYALDTTEAAMGLAVDQQQALTFGLCVFGYMNKGSDDSVVNNAEARREKKKAKAIKTLETRDRGAGYFSIPGYEDNTDIII